MCLSYFLTELRDLIQFTVYILQTQLNQIKSHYITTQTSFNRHPIQTYYALVLRLHIISSFSPLEFHFQSSQISHNSITHSFHLLNQVHLASSSPIYHLVFSSLIFILMFYLLISFLSYIFFSNLSSLFFLFHIL